MFDFLDFLRCRHIVLAQDRRSDNLVPDIFSRSTDQQSGFKVNLLAKKRAEHAIMFWENLVVL